MSARAMAFAAAVVAAAELLINRRRRRAARPPAKVTGGFQGVTAIDGQMLGSGEWIQISASGFGDPPCRVFWGSHGCMLERGHHGPHICECAMGDSDGDPRADPPADGINVGAPPYYGPNTIFYGQDWPSTNV